MHYAELNIRELSKTVIECTHSVTRLIHVPYPKRPTKAVGFKVMGCPHCTVVLLQLLPEGVPKRDPSDVFETLVMTPASPSQGA